MRGVVSLTQILSRRTGAVLYAGQTGGCGSRLGNGIVYASGPRSRSVVSAGPGNPDDSDPGPSQSAPTPGFQVKGGGGGLRVRVVLGPSPRWGAAHEPARRSRHGVRLPPPNQGPTCQVLVMVGRSELEPEPPVLRHAHA